MAKYVIEGCVSVEGVTSPDTNLHAYVLDTAGHSFGDAPLKGDGTFTVEPPLARRVAVQILIAPPGDPAKLDRSTAYAARYAATAWAKAGAGQVLHADLHIKASDLARFFRHCAVHGHIHKLVHGTQADALYPVVGAKVEVFDVDREPYPWPLLQRRWNELRYVRTVPLPELLNRPLDVPVRPPAPNPPSPTGGIFHSFTHVIALNPQPEPPCLPPPDFRACEKSGESEGVSPKPEPPAAQAYLDLIPKTIKLNGLVGEMKTLPAERMAEMAGLTLTSRRAPWELLQYKFYSKTLIGSTLTDADGAFRLDFNWFMLHVRRGRLRFDRLPDIIIRVTQYVNGIPSVIYMDPYTGTRWNQDNCEIDLVLDDPAIAAGPGQVPTQPLQVGVATIKQIGCDEIWKINRANGCFEASGYTNAAYGYQLWIRGDFGPEVLEGTSPFYYRLSYARVAGPGAPDDSAFAPITTPLVALRSPDLHDLPALIASGNFNYTEHTLGPVSVGTTGNLYEVQDRWHWWIIQGGPVTTPGGLVLGLWDTPACEPDEGLYVLRMEMFDAAGRKLTGAQFPNVEGDGSGSQPSPTPVVADHLDLKVCIDNAVMTRGIDMDAVTNTPAAMVEWDPDLANTLAFPVSLSQPHGRVGAWSVHFCVGTSPVEYELPTDPPSPNPGLNEYPAGVASVNENAPGAPLLANPVIGDPPYEHGCAYALNLYSRAHIRVSWGWWDYGHLTYPFAILKC